MTATLFRIWAWLRHWLWLRPRAVLLRETFWVDSSRGDDDAPGTRTAPIRTLAELHRRTEGRVFRGDFRVFLTGSFDEPLRVHVTTDAAGVVRVSGAAPTRAGRRRQLGKRLLISASRSLSRWWFERHAYSRAKREADFSGNAGVAELDVDSRTSHVTLMFVNIGKPRAE